MTDERVLSALIHADAKQGKSTLTSTVPLPALILDAEGSWNFIDEVGFKSGVPLRKRTWRPEQEVMPEFDGTWDILHVKVTSWNVMQICYQMLTQQEHGFVSLVLDSITEVQRRCKSNIRGGTEQMQQQQWGQLLDRMDGLIRGYRDLTLLDNSVRCVVFIAETKMLDGKWRPFMQGQIRDTLPYMVDICGYLFTEHTLDAAGVATGKEKKLLIGKHPQYEAGERVAGRLPDIIANPNISDMMNTIYPSR